MASHDSMPPAGRVRRRAAPEAVTELRIARRSLRMAAVNLFGIERSVYTRTARLALGEKEVAHTLQEVDVFGPDEVRAAHLSRHPFGRIPVLEHGDFRLYETAAIGRDADEAFVGPPLQARDRQVRARMNQPIGMPTGR